MGPRLAFAANGPDPGGRRGWARLGELGRRWWPAGAADARLRCLRSALRGANGCGCASSPAGTATRAHWLLYLAGGLVAASVWDLGVRRHRIPAAGRRPTCCWARPRHGRLRRCHRPAGLCIRPPGWGGEPAPGPAPEPAPEPTPPRVVGSSAPRSPANWRGLQQLIHSHGPHRAPRHLLPAWPR